MKKAFKAATILLLSLLVLAGCSSNKTAGVDDVEDVFAKGESAMVFVMSTDCPACKEYEPVVKEFMKENPGISHKLYINQLSEAEISKLMGIMQENDVAIQYVPTTIAIRDGVVVRNDSGPISLDVVESFAKALNLPE